MSTRSLTYVYDSGPSGTDTPEIVLCMYRQMDGYPDGQGLVRYWQRHQAAGVRRRTGDNGVMGAESFEQVGTGKTIEDAFRQAVEQARWDYGHSGYSGTIAEKGNYTVIEAPEDKDPCSYANELMLADDARITDKWGPAGAIQLGPEQWLFFGWASS